MWSCRKVRLSASVEHWTLSSAAGRALRFSDVISLWRNDTAFRKFWTSCLRQSPFPAYCWECPPLTADNLSHRFECVLVDSPVLARSAADPSPFAGHFRAGQAVATFRSLGGDAVLIAPTPAAVATDYAHLARFVANASDGAIEALWQALGEAATASRTGGIWISTAGLGVPWLHIRLDSRPKYYRHAPYRDT
ncbi:MAG: hypothetical protein JNN30_04300 [Rhodanobacteraceae bacterium]|nr:hypothetical protein [Rhodanobacteraceae bacterium]